MTDEASGAGHARLKVFISYSRDDLKFADQLKAALDLTGFETYLDRHKIEGAEDWRTRLATLIRDADTVVFVLSPASASSPICAWEVEEAARLGKRILPVLCSPLGETSAPSRLGALNFIFFYDEPKSPESGFGTGLARLVVSLKTDLDWIREHTRLLARASEWAASDRADNRLLFGADIAAAKDWAARRPKDAPEPTALHFDFIRASEEAETRRADTERRQLEDMAAANAARQNAIEEREEAFRQAADQQRRRARLRNMALVGMTLIAGLAGWQWWRVTVLQKQAAAQLTAFRVTTGMQFLILASTAGPNTRLSNGLARLNLFPDGKAEDIVRGLPDAMRKLTNEMASQALNEILSSASAGLNLDRVLNEFQLLADVISADEEINTRSPQALLRTYLDLSIHLLSPRHSRHSMLDDLDVAELLAQIDLRIGYVYERLDDSTQAIEKYAVASAQLEKYVQDPNSIDAYRNDLAWAKSKLDKLIGAKANSSP